MKRDHLEEHSTNSSEQSEDEFMEEVEYDSQEESHSASSCSMSTSQTFLPGDEIPEGMSLDWDRSCYTMMHEATSEWPCLSFDFLSEPCKDSWPMAVGLVAGSQAAQGHSNALYVIHASHLIRTYEADSDEDSDDSDSDDDDRQPILHLQAQIPHEGAVNRLRVAPASAKNQNNQKEYCASWSDLGKVFLWDLKNTSCLTPIASLSMDVEGYRIAFRPSDSAILAGSCSGLIKLWNPDSSSNARASNILFQTQSPFGSVEDLQWSPSEANVFAGASGSCMALWDLRSGKIVLEHPRAHAGADVNVLSWNHAVQYLIATGGDDGLFKIWDLRMAASSGGGGTVMGNNGDNWNCGNQSEIASIDWHKGHSITSIEWKEGVASVLAASDDQDQVTFWDMSLERDDDDCADDGDGDMKEGQKREVPSQLLFIHQGMQQVKEIHWHPRISGVIGATALSGFNIFQTVNVK